MNVFDPERHIQRLAPLGAVLIVIGVAISRWWSVPISAIGIFILITSCWSRIDGLLIFGPFLSQELRALVRRTYLHVWRTIFVTVGAIAFAAAASVRQWNPTPYAIQTAGIVLVLLSAYLIVLIALPIGLQSMQHAIAGEREGKRLDFLLVTDLRNREIILGRGLGRAMNAIGFGFGLLPFFVAIPFFFGVPALLTLVPASYAILTFLSAAGLTLYMSATSRTVKRANPKTTFIMLPFIFLTMGIELLRYVPEIWAYLFTVPGVGLVGVGDLLEYISVANPISMVIRAVTGVIGGLDPLELAAEWLPIFAAYHLSFFFIGVMKASQVLRYKSAELAGEGPIGSTESGTRQLDKPIVTDRPILWKERHFHELLPKTRTGKRIANAVGIILGYIPAVIILVAGLSGWMVLEQSVKSGLKGILPMLVWILVCAGMRVSCGVIARERERDTLTSLVMTPIPPSEIIFEKWLASIWVQQGGFIWLLMLGIPAILTGLYPWWAFIGLFILSVSFQCAGASVGVLASITGTKVELANRNAVLRSLIGIAIQALLAIIPLSLAVSQFFIPAKFFTISIFPFGALIALGFIDSCPPSDVPFWLLGGSLGAIQMFLISWLVYRRAVKKFERMCSEGTVDTGKLSSKAT